MGKRVVDEIPERLREALGTGSGSGITSTLQIRRGGLEGGVDEQI